MRIVSLSRTMRPRPRSRALLNLAGVVATDDITQRAAGLRMRMPIGERARRSESGLRFSANGVTLTLSWLPACQDGSAAD
jgi:hypothetical protein